MADSKQNITVFLCDWLPGAGNGYNGVSVTCAAKVDAAGVLRELMAGADGVLVPGCSPDDCQHVSGVLHTERNVRIARLLLREAGLAPDRVMLGAVSPGDESGFESVLSGFAESVQGLGPLGRESGLADEEARSRLASAVDAAGSKRVKWLVGKEPGLVGKQNLFGQPVARSHYDQVTDEAVSDEYMAASITRLLREEPRSVKELAARIGVEPASVLFALMDMRGMGKVSVKEVRGKTPVYQIKQA